MTSLLTPQQRDRYYTIKWAQKEVDKRKAKEVTEKRRKWEEVHDADDDLALIAKARRIIADDGAELRRYLSDWSESSIMYVVHCVRIEAEGDVLDEALDQIITELELEAYHGE